jgi:hypothetical protein
MYIDNPPSSFLDPMLLKNAARMIIKVEDGEPLEPSELIINAHGLENINGLRG